MKKGVKLAFVCGIILLFALSGCSLLKTAAGGANSNVLFQDDFSNSSSGWDQVSGDQGWTDYKDGAYHIHVDITNSDLWANPGKSFGDVSIETDAFKVDGPDDNDFGLICRYQDVDNYYFVAAANDGYYVLGKVVDGTQEPLMGDGWAQTDKVYSGTTTNHLRLDCVGDTISFYINGNLMGEATDSDYATGDVGLIAGTFGTEGVEVAFDNFVVTKP